MHGENQSALLFGGDPTMQMAFVPIFGNRAFQINPSETGEVSNAFGTIPYIAIEGIIQQQGGGMIDPTSVLPGQNQGQQNIQGSYTVQDSNGLTRMVMGYQQGGF